MRITSRALAALAVPALALAATGAATGAKAQEYPEKPITLVAPYGPGGASVINVSSIGGLRTNPMLGAYDVTKAALTHLTRAADLRPDQRAMPSLISAVVHFRKNDLHQAKIHLLRAQAGMSKHWLIPLMQATVAAANGDAESAQGYLRQLGDNQGAKRLAAMIKAGDIPQLGLGPDGTPGIVGLTLRD